MSRRWPRTCCSEQPGKKGFKRFKVVDYQSFVAKASEHCSHPCRRPHKFYCLGGQCGCCYAVPDSVHLAHIVEHSVLTAADVDAAVELASQVMGRGEPVFQLALEPKGFNEAKHIGTLREECFGPMRDLLVGIGMSAIAQIGDRVHALGPPPCFLRPSSNIRC